MLIIIVSIMTWLARMLSIRTKVYLINRPEAKPRDIKDIPRLILNILARQCHYCHCIMSKCMETSLQTFCSSSSLSSSTQRIRAHWAANSALMTAA